MHAIDVSRSTIKEESELNTTWTEQTQPSTDGTTSANFTSQKSNTRSDSDAWTSTTGYIHTKLQTGSLTIKSTTSPESISNLTLETTTSGMC